MIRSLKLLITYMSLRTFLRKCLNLSLLPGAKKAKHTEQLVSRVM